jgi:hypothetical protein
VKPGIAGVAIAIVLSGCAWVEYTEAGKAVRVLAAEDVADCERRGIVTATTKDRAMGLARQEEIVVGELNTLAANQAATIGGDSIVPEGTRQKGTQTYAVYRCR